MATNLSANVPILPGEGASTRPLRRRTSLVWEFFMLKRRPADAASTGAQDRAVCPNCFKELTTGSTSHLRRHRCYQEWFNNKPPTTVPLPAAAPDAIAAALPAPTSAVIAAAGEDGDDGLFDDLDDIVTNYHSYSY